MKRNRKTFVDFLRTAENCLWICILLSEWQRSTTVQISRAERSFNTHLSPIVSDFGLNTTTPKIKIHRQWPPDFKVKLDFTTQALLALVTMMGSQCCIRTHPPLCIDMCTLWLWRAGHGRQKCFFKRLHKAQLLLRGEISPQDHTCTTTDVRQDGPVLSCCFCQILSLYRKSPEARKFLKYYNYRTPSAMLRYVPLITAQPRSDAWLELAGHLSHIPKCSCCHVIGWLYSGMQTFGQPC